MLTERQIRLQEVCEFLDKHNWLKIESGKRKIIYQAPEDLGFTEPCKICLPANFEFTDFDKSLDRNINFIAEAYDISPHEVSKTVKAIDTILSVRMIGEKTIDIDDTGKITELSSKDPSGDENRIIVSCGNKKLELNLNKSEYRKAVDAHIDQSDVKIKGLAKKGTKSIKITRLDSFEVCD